jgi:hypothetical protein
MDKFLDHDKKKIIKETSMSQYNQINWHDTSHQKNKEKTYTIIMVNAERALDKFSTPLWFKKSEKLGLEGM